MHTAIFQPFPMLSGRTAQVWRHQPAYRRPRHFHEEPELNLVVKGMARLGVGDRVEILRAGQLVLFEPGQDHVLLEASPDLELFVMALKPELAARVHGQRPFVLNRTVALDEPELASVSERATAVNDMRDALGVQTAVGDLFAALGSCRRTSQVNTRRAISRLNDARSASGAELAQLLRSDRSRVSREFHRDLGVTLVEYRARLRLMHCIHLVDSGSSLARAAMDADFGSYAQFHRVFQRAVGCGPKAYFAGKRELVTAATEPEAGVSTVTL